MSELKITILGSGTSVGVPVIGCTCEVCTTQRPKNIRSRCSLLIEFPTGEKVVFDTSPDFRQQILTAKVSMIDGVVYTHTHADHLHGLDDLRAFWFHSKKPVKCWISPVHLDDLKSRFSYVFNDTGYPGSPPQVDLSLIDNDFNLFGVPIETFQLPHGPGTTTAFRIGSFVYATDFQYFPEEIKNKLKGQIHTMIASGVGWEPHKTHSSVTETTQLFKDLEVQRGIVHHLAHTVDYYQHTLDSPYEFAYDQQQLTAPI